MPRKGKDGDPDKKENVDRKSRNVTGGTAHGILGGSI